MFIYSNTIFFNRFGKADKWEDVGLSLPTEFLLSDKCIAGEGHKRKQVPDEEQEHAAPFMSSLGLKINPSIRTFTCLHSSSAHPDDNYLPLAARYRGELSPLATTSAHRGCRE